MINNSTQESSITWWTFWTCEAGLLTRSPRCPRRIRCRGLAVRCWYGLLAGKARCWRSAGTSRDASACRSAAGPRRTCGASAGSCCGSRFPAPASPGSPVEATEYFISIRISKNEKYLLLSCVSSLNLLFLYYVPKFQIMQKFTQYGTTTRYFKFMITKVMKQISKNSNVWEVFLSVSPLFLYTLMSASNNFYANFRPSWVHCARIPNYFYILFIFYSILFIYILQQLAKFLYFSLFYIKNVT